MQINKFRYPIIFIVFVMLITLAINLFQLYYSYETAAPLKTLSPPPAATATPETQEIPTPLPIANAAETSTAPIRLAWFTSLPKETNDILLVANWFDLFILIQGDEDSRDLIRAQKVDGPILQYIEFQSVQDPGSCTDDPKINQVAYLPGDFCFISEKHPDWFLLDINGQRISVQDSDNTWYVMDPGNNGWRSFFLERAKKIQQDPNWDGIFLDNVPVTLAFREADGNIPALYPDDTSYQAAIQGFIKYLHEEYFQPSGKLLFANLVSRKDDAQWLQQLTFLDGAMHEGWAIDWPGGYRTPQEWEKHMKLAEQTQQMGKYIILVSQGKKEDTILQEFAYASYLLINQDHAYFRYANSDHYRDIWLYETYKQDLGSPLGARYPAGKFWTRDFTNGHVSVNPETHEVQIIIEK